MLNSFRSIAGSFWAKGLLLLLVLSFAIWGIGDVLRTSGRNPTIATVGGIDISAQEFMRAMHQETENLRRVMGENYSPDLAKNMNLSHWVLQKLINNALMKQAVEEIGIIPSDADVVKRIRTNSEFQDAKGNFDKNIFEARLRSMGLSEKSYVERLREDIGITALVDTLTAATPVSDVAVRTLLEAREEQRSVTLYSLGASMVGSVPKPDDAQIKAYYDAHSHEFTAPEYRSVSYVSLTNADVPKESAMSEDDLRALYNDRIDEFKRPERRTVEQLLFGSEDKAKAAKDMFKAGKSFDQIAKELPVLNKDSVSMGKIERSALIENAESAVFSLAKGEITDPIQSPFGWHLFHVTAIEPPSTSSFEDVRATLEKDLKQHGSDQALSRLANKFEDALAGGSSFAEAAHEFNLKVLKVGPINRQGLSQDGKANTGVPSLDKFLETAFKTDENSESQMIMSKGGVYYIVHVDSITPERVRPLEEVQQDVISACQKEEQQKRLSVIAKEVSEKFTNPDERAKIISKYNLSSIAVSNIKRSARSIYNTPLPAAMVSDIFSRKVHGGTVAYPAKNGGYLLAEVNSITPTTITDKDAKFANAKLELHKTLETTVQNEILDQYAHMLMEKYPVHVYQSALESVLQ